MTLENHTASVTLAEILACNGSEDSLRGLLKELCYADDDPRHERIAVLGYRMVQVEHSSGVPTLQFDVSFSILDTLEYEVVLTNTFEAESPNDAVLQMIEWIGSTDINHAGFQVNWTTDNDTPQSILVDGDNITEQS